MDSSTKNIQNKTASPIAQQSGIENDLKSGNKNPEKTSGEESLPVYMKGYDKVREDSVTHGKRSSVYNFGVDDFDASTIKKHAWKVFNELMGKPAKVAFYAGFILDNNVTGNYRYFHPSSGTQMLDTFRLNTKEDFKKIVERFENFDWDWWCHEFQETPQSTAVVAMNLQIVTFYTDFPSSRW